MALVDTVQKIPIAEPMDLQQIITTTKADLFARQAILLMFTSIMQHTLAELRIAKMHWVIAMIIMRCRWKLLVLQDNNVCRAHALR